MNDMAPRLDTFGIVMGFTLGLAIALIGGGTAVMAGATFGAAMGLAMARPTRWWVPAVAVSACLPLQLGVTAGMVVAAVCAVWGAAIGGFLRQPLRPDAISRR